MNTQSNVAPESLESQAVVPWAINPSRHLYWSVRRELWESRSIYVAPLGVAGLYLLGFVIGLIHLPDKLRSAAGLVPAKQFHLVAQPYSFASLLIMGTTFIVAIFYCLDALHGERRDRSILFWKSLPVSDLTTVLAKMSIPLLVVPLLTFAITVATHCIMLMFTSGALLLSGGSLAAVWNHLPLLHMWLVLLDHLVAIHGLWYAPIFAWLLLVSAWATRAPFLWAALPPLAVAVAEKVAFNTTHFVTLIAYRMSGGPQAAKFMAQDMSMDPLMQLNPGEFLRTPGLWMGWAMAALFLFAAVRLRRYRGPI